MHNTQQLEAKKKSMFQKFSFRKKKSDRREQELGEQTAHLSQISDTNQSEKEPPDFSEKNVVLSPEQNEDNINIISNDVSILLSLDTPSCFMPNINVSQFPNTQIYKLALHANKENLKLITSRIGEDHAEVKMRKMQTAEVYKGLGMLQEAADLLREVIDSCTRSDDDDDPVLLSSAMNDLALVYSTLHRHDNAEDLFHKTVKILSQTVEADQAVVWGNIAITLRKSGNFSKAIPMHELAVKMMETILGTDSPEALFQRGQLAVTLKQAGEAGDQQRGDALLASSISELETLGYGPTHVWIKDLLQ
jgi:tetratricopeptide (TPR) repeat protein